MISMFAIESASALLACCLCSEAAFSQQDSRAPPEAHTISTETTASPPSRFPSGCAVAVREGKSDVRYVPRAALLIVNDLPYAIRVTAGERLELGPGRRPLGIVEAGRNQLFLRALLAGRNIISAIGLGGGEQAIAKNQPFYIRNFGPLTCARTAVWPIR